MTKQSNNWKESNLLFLGIEIESHSRKLNPPHWRFLDQGTCLDLLERMSWEMLIGWIALMRSCVKTDSIRNSHQFFVRAFDPGEDTCYVFQFYRHSNLTWFCCVFCCKSISKSSDHNNGRCCGSAFIIVLQKWVSSISDSLNSGVSFQVVIT